MSIAENIHKYRENVKPATLVAVSKTKPKEAIEEAYAAGQRVFGENRVQELVDKYEALPKDIEWHLIGHLQRNKVKYIAPFVSLIHAVDSVRLLEEIQKQAEINQRKIPVLLQMHIAEESEKFGFSEEELMRFLDDGVASEKYPNVLFSGMMGMATFTDDEHQIRQEFGNLKLLFDRIRSGFFSENDAFRTLSMGMSGDYSIALACGSTMVRIGSSIFGSR